MDLSYTTTNIQQSCRVRHMDACVKTMTYQSIMLTPSSWWQNFLGRCWCHYAATNQPIEGQSIGEDLPKVQVHVPW